MFKSFIYIIQKSKHFLWVTKSIDRFPGVFFNYTHWLENVWNPLVMILPVCRWIYCVLLKSFQYIAFFVKLILYRRLSKYKYNIKIWKLKWIILITDCSLIMHVFPTFFFLSSLNLIYSRCYKILQQIRGIS